MNLSNMSPTSDSCSKLPPVETRFEWVADVRVKKTKIEKKETFILKARFSNAVHAVGVGLEVPETINGFDVFSSLLANHNQDCCRKSPRRITLQ